ncbi:glucose-6-phosphate isomerase [Wolinella succinogenes]|uniref:glucose-6-phosphate isomerase n=1 Tax=Wolinella succinogenes TaxID=844 RepID=UPI00240A3CFE|nr:glucose-6-phosphate isomerase [Wolinella succinogenes]
MLEFQHFFTTSFSDEEREALLGRVKKEREEGVSAYYDLPFQRRALEDSDRYMKANAAFLERLETILVVGVGGSSLGLKAIDSLLSHLPERRAIDLHFLEHTDPIAIEKSLRGIQTKNSLFIVISKSGSTIETSSLTKYVLKRFELLKEENRSHLLVITDEGSPLEQWSKQEDVACVTIHPKVGGRFSVLSAVGILPLSLLGYPANEILEGAKGMAVEFFAGRATQILDKALFYAKERNRFSINVLFSYASAFKEFNAWYVQLWGESLGKLNAQGNRTGMTPAALIGSIDQHSFLQLIVQGPLDKSVTFLSIKEPLKEPIEIPNWSMEFLEGTDFVNGSSFKDLLRHQREATMETVIEEGVPTDLILIDRLEGRSVGALLYYYELLTSCVGALLEINTYDQPGVEFGKRRLREKFHSKDTL